MVEEKRYDLKNLTLFFIITFGWSWGLWLFPILNSLGFNIPEFLLMLSMSANFGPLIGAVVVTSLISGKEGIKDLIKRGWDVSFNKIWLLPILFLVPLIAFFTMIIVIVFEGSWILTYTTSWSMFFPILLMIFFTGGSLGEEYGWRGFVIDRFQSKWSALVSSLILGVIWGIWHLPLHFITGTTQEVIPIYQNIIIITLSSISYTWLYNSTGGSVLVAMLFHTANNMSGALFPYWVTDFGRWVFFGFMLVLNLIIIVYYGQKRLVRTKEKY